MKKLELVQIMRLAEKLEHNVWIITLMDLNNKGQLEQFFETINAKPLLQSVLQDEKKSKSR